jgi:acetylornithine deacetylase
MIAGHVDVASVSGQQWKTDPFTAVSRDGRLYGRGASDAKSGVAAAMQVMAASGMAWGKRAGSLTLVLSADEDSEGRWGLPWLAACNHLHADAAIVVSPAGEHTDFDGIPLASRGYANARVEVASGYTWSYQPTAPHAVAIACRLLGKLEHEFRPSPRHHALYPAGSTVTAGSLFRGGEQEGVIPTSASFSVECRTLPGATAASFFEEMQSFVSANALSAHARVVQADWMWSGGWGQGCDLSASHPLAVAASDAVRQVTGSNAGHVGFPMFSEASCIAALGIPTLPALGPGTWRSAHAADECVNEQALERGAAILQRVVDECLSPATALPRRSA